MDYSSNTGFRFVEKPYRAILSHMCQHFTLHEQPANAERDLTASMDLIEYQQRVIAGLKSTSRVMAKASTYLTMLVERQAFYRRARDRFRAELAKLEG